MPSLSIIAIIALLVITVLFLLILVYLQYMPPAQVLMPHKGLWVSTTGGVAMNTLTPYYKVSKGLYVNSDGSYCAVVIKCDDGKKYGIVTDYSVTTDTNGVNWAGPLFPSATAAAGSWSGYGQIPCNGLNVCCYPGLETPPAYLSSAAKFCSQRTSFSASS